MKKLIIMMALLPVLIFCCKSKPKSLTDQLKSNFLSHLNKMDSSLVLDSFEIIKTDTMNQRLFSVIDDTIYRRILARVQSQMESARKKNLADSMAFYQEELDYMIPASDSLTKVISYSDTTKKYGIIATCKVQVTKKSVSKTEKFYYFLSRNSTVVNSEMIDSAITRLSRSWN